MDPSELYRRIARSADELYWYQDVHPETAESVVGVRSCDVFDGYAILHLESRLQDTTGIRLRVGQDTLDEEASGFERYDEVSRTIIARPGTRFLDAMSDGAEASVVSDMNFLVRAAGEFYKRYGPMVAVPGPPRDPPVPTFPSEGVPSPMQRSAAEAVSRSAMSYVWGAPGTGKTQYVLSACIRGCLARGQRVAVFAPTNNSVEQVLRGIMASFGDSGCPDGIIRLGVPSARFLRDHPEMCEDRQAQRRQAECLRALDNLEEVAYERRCDAVLGDIDAISSAEGGFWDRGDLEARRPDLVPALGRIEAVCALRPMTSEVLEGDRPLAERLSTLRTLLYGRERCARNISEFESWSDADIAASVEEYREELEALNSRSTEERVSNATIIAMTPHQFLSRFRPRGSDEDTRMELDVDRIFLDEAGYCGLVQALALFTNGVPVAMFGDHMQLPPVEQIEDAIVRDAAKRGSILQDLFLWNLSALYCESLMRCGVDGLRILYLDERDPIFENTVRRDLTESRRFGTNLASILDRFVYGNGLRGDDGRCLEIDVIDVRCDEKEDRANPEEAKAVSVFLKGSGIDPSKVCVLTPYRRQLSILRSRVGRKFSDCVMTVHGSQGREWDTVVLSISDNRTAVRDVPYRFTSSSTPIGLRLMNTALSRAQRRLVVVCDAEFWESREGELIGEVVRAGRRMEDS
ncbi:MAG: AAA domain-containing protein [Thermoplasmata archaeon]|nr:AAA domain-containing protein [Thermoplasmata archaeon]